MARGFESRRHFPGAVALKIAEDADGTRSVAATLKLNQVSLSSHRRSISMQLPGLQQSAYC